MISKYLTQFIIINTILIQKFLLRIAIAFSAGRQLNIPKHISTTSCDLVFSQKFLLPHMFHEVYNRIHIWQSYKFA